MPATLRGSSRKGREIITPAFATCTANSEARSLPLFSSESSDYDLDATNGTAERSRKRSASKVASKINPHIEALVRTLLGLPNEKLSSRNELRFGNKGSVSVQLTGPNAGKWYDHEKAVGGDAIKLIQHCNHCSFDEACDWFETNIGLVEPATLSCDESVDEKEVTKKAKVKEIIDESIDVQGTPGELYLKSRGITAEMPDRIRFRYNAWEPYGALVAESYRR